jgi:hypothetical protein
VTWRLEIPLKPPNLNGRSVNRAGGRAASVRRAFAAEAARYRRARGVWLLMIKNAAQLTGCPAASGKRRVVYTRIMSPRERSWDEDNLMGGGKMVFDALKAAGLLVDDNRAMCEREYAEERGPESGLRLEISDLKTKEIER